jgi:hypothetical protein
MAKGRTRKRANGKRTNQEKAMKRRLIDDNKYEWGRRTIAADMN